MAAASFTTLRKESLRQKSFYVPEFEVKVQNAGLPNDVVRDIVQVTYHDNINEIDGFEFTVNNWDAGTQTFKYVGGETDSTLNRGPQSGYYKLFEPCGKKVELSMGYMGDLRLMLTGRFTSLEPNFPGNGAPTLAVRGQNVLAELRKKQYTYAWTQKRDSEIAKDLQSLTDPANGSKRVPANIVINKKAMSREPKLDYVAEDSQYDIDFLLTRARQRGYVLVLTEDKKGGMPTLYFGPSNDSERTVARAITFQLDWGSSLIDFKPTLTTANQVKSVTVHGWNRRTRKPIVEKASLDSKPFRLNEDLQRLVRGCNVREEIVVNRPVFTTKQAKDLALAILLENSKQLVKATGTTIGLPDLRAGVNVYIGGLGSRFSGTYFVTDTTHAIGNNGYTTKFTARREQIP